MPSWVLLLATGAWAKGPSLADPPASVALIVEDVTPTGNGGHVVFLTDAEHARIVPIEVGEAEAVSIAFRLAKRGRPRPMTHDLFEDAVTALGGRVVQVHVHTFHAGEFQARVSVQRKKTLIHLDARASDGIALALGADVPVWMDETLYASSGVTMGDLLNSLDVLKALGREDGDGAL